MLLILLGLTLSLLIVEGAVRVSGLSPRVYSFQVRGADATFQLSSNPILGYEMRPNLRRESFDCHNSFPFTNSLGFRDVEHAEVPQAPARQRVILLGDSVAAGHGLCDTEKILPRVMERESGGAIEVLNFGIGGYCTRAEVELLKEKGLRLHPDIVVVLFVENDYTNSNGTIIESLGSRAPFSELASRSALVRLVAGRLNLGLWRGEELSRNSNAIGLENVRSGLQLLRDLAAAEHFRPLIVTWPYFNDAHILEPSRQHTTHLVPPQSVHRIARELGIPLVKISGRFRDDFKERARARTTKRLASPRWIYTQGDGVHPSELGSELGGRYLADAVLSFGRGEGRPAPRSGGIAPASSPTQDRSDADEDEVSEG